MKSKLAVPIIICLSLILCIAVAMGSVSGNPIPAAEQDYSINLAELYQAPENYPHTQVTVFKDAEEYIAALGADENLSPETKKFLVDDVTSDSEATQDTAYGVIRQEAAVTAEYSAYPYFYVVFEQSGTDAPLGVLSIKSIGLDRLHNGVSKEFSGSLYCNLESAGRIYWDLNGDFYNVDTTSDTVRDGVNIGDSFKANFTVTTTSGHYSYLQQAGSFNL